MSPVPDTPVALRVSHAALVVYCPTGTAEQVQAGLAALPASRVAAIR